MSDWGDLSADSYEAARKLSEAGHPRSCVSRAYFAAYCALVSRLPGGVSSPLGRRNPSHQQLLKLVKSLKAYGARKRDRNALKSHLHYLRELRNGADYRPEISVTQAEASRALSVSHAVCREMGCV